MSEEVFKRPCPECGASVDARRVPSSDGLGVQPWLLQVKKGPEHEVRCKWYVADGKKRTTP